MKHAKPKKEMSMRNGLKTCTHTYFRCPAPSTPGAGLVEGGWGGADEEPRPGALGSLFTCLQRRTTPQGVGIPGKQVSKKEAVTITK